MNRTYRTWNDFCHIDDYLILTNTVCLCDVWSLSIWNIFLCGGLLMAMTFRWRLVEAGSQDAFGARCRVGGGVHSIIYTSLSIICSSFFRLVLGARVIFHVHFSCVSLTLFSNWTVLWCSSWIIQIMPTAVSLSHLCVRNCDVFGRGHTLGFTLFGVVSSYPK